MRKYLHVIYKLGNINEEMQAEYGEDLKNKYTEIIKLKY